MLSWVAWLAGWLVATLLIAILLFLIRTEATISKVPIDAILFSHENNLFEFVKICNSNAFRSMTKVTLMTSVVACCGENVLQSRLRNVVDVINGHFNQACRTCTLLTVQSTGLSKYFCFFAKNMSVFLHKALFWRRGVCVCSKCGRSVKANYLLSLLCFVLFRQNAVVVVVVVLWLEQNRKSRVTETKLKSAEYNEC